MAVIFGTDGPDFLPGTGDRDWIFGFDGDDEIQGGAGSQVHFGGGGEDSAVYSDLDFGVWANLHAGGAQSIDRDFFFSIENVIGTDFADVIIGTFGANVLSGGDGDDLIFASGGDDVVHGGDGDDYIKGGRGFGDDVLDGGEGDDFITSGWWVGETDTIIFEAGGGEDVVEFFNVESDQLALVGLSSDQLEVTDLDTGTLIEADTGDSVFLIGVHDVGLGDLILV